MIVRAGFDVDGVVGDFLGYMASKGIIGSMKRDHGDEVDKLIRREMQRPGMWVDMPVMEGAKSAMATLRGIPVMFISSIPREFSELRTWWLDRHFGKYLGAYGTGWSFVSVKHAEKVQEALDYGLTHFIEDSPDTALAMKAAGLESYLVPYSAPAEGIEEVDIGAYARIVKRAHQERNHSNYLDKYAMELAR